MRRHDSTRQNTYQASGLRPGRARTALPCSPSPTPPTTRTGQPAPPLLQGKALAEPSVFTAANLLREARRQRHLRPYRVPSACLLDPDGDVVRHLADRSMAAGQPAWACYHTRLWTTSWAG